MAIGHPDFGQAAPGVLISPVADLGELAVRLGGPSNIDRAGNVFYQNTFHDGLENLSVSAVVGSGSGQIRTDGALQGPSCLRITNSAGLGDYTQVTKVLPYVNGGSFGLSVAVAALSGVPRIVIYLVSHDGTTEHFAEGFLRADTNQAYYLATGAVETALGSKVIVTNATPRYMYLKLVVDLANSKYKRFMVDGVTYDLTGKATSNGPDATPPEITANLYVYNQTAAAAVVVVDNFIVTFNEA